MERYIDMLQRTLELSDTCLEGFLYVKDQLDGIYQEQATILLQDAVEAFYKMKFALDIIENQLEENALDDYTSDISLVMEHVITSLEQNNPELCVYLLESSVIPAFITWKKELDRLLLPICHQYLH
ncbi:hypothetical protein [Gorillibacterium sp. sgz5001074]|uniref:hypothetical protein n=1 Tax=Gorillibacterium sp. sgz5001074 TaxID=3446695 RepID=UPI003F6762D6